MLNVKRGGIRISRRAAVVVALLAVGGSAGFTQEMRLSAQNAGDHIYDFSGQDMNGKTHSSAHFKGKIVLLDFWATWCPPCRAEVPNIAKVYRQFHGQGFEVLGVTLDRDQAAVKPFTDKSGMAWPEIYDAKQSARLADRFKVTAIPTSFLFDGTTGKIIAKDLRGDTLRTKVKAAIAAIPKKK
jgi:thiol-disulfide isomerase/thioredoxin